jgi:hypothetical protein
LIAQHAIGVPELQRQTLMLMNRCQAESRIPSWLADCVGNRIATYEGRPQSLGKQWLDDPQRVNELRATIGLPVRRPIPEPGLNLPAYRQNETRQNHRWWQGWIGST